MAKSWDDRTKQLQMEAAQRLDPRASSYQVDPDVAVELLRLQQESGMTESVFRSLPTAPSRGEFTKSGAYAEAKSLYFDDAVKASSLGYDITSGKYYVQGGAAFSNRAEDPRDLVEKPAPITIKPTATSNPKRPRTVAAGYRPGTSEDGRKGTLTVIFRDGTYYNYYDVAPNTWGYFKIASSKGRFIRKYLDGHPRGYADISYITDLAQKAEYFISRTNQIISRGSQGQFPKRQPSLQRRLQMAERAARRAAKTGGKNTSTANKPRRSKP
jgi:hypothetical protein